MRGIGITSFLQTRKPTHFLSYQNLDGRIRLGGRRSEKDFNVLEDKRFEQAQSKTRKRARLVGKWVNRSAPVVTISPYLEGLSMTMKRACIFCGKPPQKKNCEHILPKWLLELTGDPGRVVTLGTNRGKSPPELIRFSFERFEFPSCSTCNSEFAKLEGDAKQVVSRLLDDAPVEPAGLSTLLDWFDKVRVGLWLAFRMLEKNLMGIDPAFHINDRIGTGDRLLCIYKGVIRESRLNFGGIESPVFKMMPSCFMLVINHLHFFNASHQFMLHAQMGLPIPFGQSRREGSPLAYSGITNGSETLNDDIAPFDVRDGGLEIYQAVIPLAMRGQNPGEFDRLFGTEYVRGLIESKSGKSKLITKSPISSNPIQLDAIAEISTVNDIGRKPLLSSLLIQTFEWQEQMQLDKMSARLEGFSEEAATAQANIEQRALEIHRAMMYKSIEMIDNEAL